MLALALLACHQDVTLTGEVPAGISDGELEDTSAWDGATLQVVSPSSGSFLPWQDPSVFQAVVYDAAGNATDFTDITWSSDVDAVWTPPVAANFEDATLDVGTHALTATAVLPNGDRLVYTIGGVLVQSIYTGVYTGTLVANVAAEYDGTAYEFGCSGALTMVVDPYGQVATGDAGCLLSMMGYELDTAYAFELENDDGELEGQAAVDLSVYQYEMESSGSVDEDGELEGSFSDEVMGYAELDGTYSATRVSRDISEYL